MAQTQTAKFSCSACGKQYTWKPELAGKPGKCKCGQAMKIPSKPPTESKGEIDLGLDAAALAALAKPSVRPGNIACPSCGLSLSPETVVCISCGFNVKTGERLVTKQFASEAPPKPRMPVPDGRGSDGGNKRLGTKGGGGETIATVIKAVAGVAVFMAIIGLKVYLKVNRATRNLGGADSSYVAKNAHDTLAMEYLADDDPIEAREYINAHESRSLGTNLTNNQSKNMIDRWYTEFQAKKVWAFNALISGKVVIELPDDAQARKKLLVWAANRAGDKGDEPQWQDVGQKYLPVDTMFR